jgi:hypothetical protein
MRIGKDAFGETPNTARETRALPMKQKEALCLRSRFAERRFENLRNGRQECLRYADAMAAR